MKKSFIAGIAAGLIAATTAFGIVRADEPHQLTYVVINRVNLDGTTNCDLTLRRPIADTLKKYYAIDTVRDDLCVTKIDLTTSGVEQLPEELGDALQGLYPAEDANHNPIQFNIYLPVIHN